MKLEWVKEKRGMVELECVLWCVILLSLIVGGFQIHRRYQKKMLEIREEFNREWINLTSR